MKKREFIKAGVTTAVAAPLLAQAAGSDRLFGTPGSVDPKVSRSSMIRLSISRADLPVETWDETERYISAVAKLFDDPVARSEFVESPGVYFSRAGVKALAGNVEQSRDLAFLRIALDPAVQSRVAAGDYEAVFTAMKDANLLVSKPGGLTRRISAAIEANRSVYEKFVGGADSSRRGAQEVVEVILGGGHRHLQVTPAPLRQYVYADTNVAITSDVVVSSEIIGGLYVAVSAIVVVVAFLAPVGSAQSLLPALGSGVGRLDEKLMEDYRAASEMARLLGSPGLGMEALKTLVHQEISAIVEAMASSGLYDRAALESERVKEQLLERVDHMLALD